MIKCQKCFVMNKSETTICQECGSNLLPGGTGKKRLLYIMMGLLLLIFGCSMEINLLTDTNSRAAKVGFGFLILIAIYVIQQAPGSKAKHVLYSERAARHIGVDNGQAESDFGEAIRLAPASALYRNDRATFYAGINRFADARADLVEALKLVEENKSKKQAYQSLQSILEKPVEPAEMDEATRIQSLINQKKWSECAQFGAPAAEPLVKFILGSSPFSSGGALDALVKIGQPAIEPLISMLLNIYPERWEEFVKTLKKIGSTNENDVAESLISKFVDAVKNGDSSTTEAIANVLFWVKLPAVGRSLSAISTDLDQDVHLREVIQPILKRIKVYGAKWN
jgi:tetratricopeptide (TPR) repeat protein